VIASVVQKNKKKHIVESFEWISASLQEKLVYPNKSLFCLDMLQEIQTKFVWTALHLGTSKNNVHNTKMYSSYQYIMDFSFQ
jgi:hypothetical protein